MFVFLCGLSKLAAGTAAAFSGCTHNHDDGKHIQACGEGGLQRESAHLAGRSVLHSQSPQRRGLARWRLGRMGRWRRRRSSASERARRGRRPGHDGRERPTSSQSHREEARGLVRTTRTPTGCCPHMFFPSHTRGPTRHAVVSGSQPGGDRTITAALFPLKIFNNRTGEGRPFALLLGRSWPMLLELLHRQQAFPKPHSLGLQAQNAAPAKRRARCTPPHWTTVDMTHSLVQSHRSPRAAPGWRWGHIYRRGCYPVTRVPVHTSLIGLFGKPSTDGNRCCP